MFKSCTWWPVIPTQKRLDRQMLGWPVSYGLMDEHQTSRRLCLHKTRQMAPENNAHAILTYVAVLFSGQRVSFVDSGTTIRM